MSRLAMSARGRAACRHDQAIVVSTFGNPSGGRQSVEEWLRCHEPRANGVRRETRNRKSFEHRRDGGIRLAGLTELKRWIGMFALAGGQRENPVALDAIVNRLPCSDAEQLGDLPGVEQRTEVATPDRAGHGEQSAPPAKRTRIAQLRIGLVDPKLRQGLLKCFRCHASSHESKLVCQDRQVKTVKNQTSTADLQLCLPHVDRQCHRINLPQVSRVVDYNIDKDYFIDMSPAQTSYVGEFEQLVLLAILQLGSEAYGVTIGRELEDRAGRSVARGALYTTLDRLEDKGLVRWKLAPGGDARRRVPRRCYSVTARGVTALKASQQVLRRMWNGLEDILGGEGR